MAFAALLSFAPAIILLQFCFNPLYKIYSLESISEPAFFSLKYIKYCISCITVYTYTIKTAERFSVPPRLSKNPGVDKGPQPLMALFGFGDMCGKSAKGACVARLSLHEVLAAP